MRCDQCALCLPSEEQLFHQLLAVSTFESVQPSQAETALLSTRPLVAKSKQQRCS